jgi:hypothetical protein
MSSYSKTVKAFAAGANALPIQFASMLCAQGLCILEFYGLFATT